MSNQNHQDYQHHQTITTTKPRPPPVAANNKQNPRCTAAYKSHAAPQHKPTAHSKTKQPRIHTKLGNTMTDTNTTNQSLIDAIAAIVGKTNEAEDSLNKAKSQHEKSGDNSIRALSTLVAGINTPLDKKTITTIADGVATKIAKGNTNIKKARKSEIKLILGQRSALPKIITELDTVIASRSEDERKINLRSAVMATLRITRDTSTDSMEFDPAQAVEEYLLKIDHTKSDVEKTEELFRRITSNKLLRVTDADNASHPHEAIQRLEAAVLAVLGGKGQEELDKLLSTPPSAPEEDNDTVDDIFADIDAEIQVLDLVADEVACIDAGIDALQEGQEAGDDPDADKKDGDDDDLVVDDAFDAVDLESLMSGVL